MILLVSETHLEPNQKSTMERLCGNSKRFLAVNYFRKKALSYLPN